MVIVIAVVSACNPTSAATPADPGTGPHTGEIVAPTALPPPPVDDRAFPRVGGCVLAIVDGRKWAPATCR